MPLSFLAKGTTPRPRCRCPSFIKRNRILCRVWAGRMPQAKRDQCLKTFCAHNGTPMGLSVKRVHPSFMIDHHNLINNVKHNISICIYNIHCYTYISIYIWEIVSDRRCFRSSSACWCPLGQRLESLDRQGAQQSPAEIASAVPNCHGGTPQKKWFYNGNIWKLHF